MTEKDIIDIILAEEGSGGYKDLDFSDPWLEKKAAKIIALSDAAVKAERAGGALVLQQALDKLQSLHKYNTERMSEILEALEARISGGKNA